MSSKNETTIRVLVVDDSMEDAEALVTGLRNDGMAIRATRATSEDEFRTIVSGQAIDLALVAGSSKAVAPARTVELARATGKDLPVVLMVDNISEAGLVPLIELGAHNLALRNKAGQVREVVRREFEDLTARRSLRKLEAQLRETERRCDSLIDSSRDPIAYIHEGMHIRANNAYLEMFGYEEFEDIEGMSILDMVAPGHAEAFKALLKELSKGEAPPPRYELTARDAMGQDFPASMEFSPATYEGEHCQQIIFRRQEQSFDPAMAEEMEALRRQDVGTGLLNRPTFLQSLEDMVAKAASAGEHHGLLLVQPDHFQALLQQVGMNNVDSLMGALAERLKPVLGEGVEAARFGEQVIGILARNSAHEKTQALAERIVAAVNSQIVSAGNNSVTVTVSVGAVQVSERNAQVPRVLSKATELLEAAQGVGGNRIELYDPGAQDRAEQDRIAAWVERIRTALAGDELVLHFQPIISLQGNNEPFYDALVRLDNGNGELVMPTAFMGIAEEHGLITDLDRGVIAKAVRTLAEHKAKGLRLIVRISQASLEDPELATYIQQTLMKYMVAADRLVVQIGESKISTQLNRAISLAQHLAQFGCVFCVDQLGVGLNSHQLLAHLRPGLVKLDGSFMVDYSRSPEQQEKVKELAEAAQAVGAATISTEVADPGSMTTLFLAGVEYVQGNFFATPSANLDFEF